MWCSVSSRLPAEVAVADEEGPPAAFSGPRPTALGPAHDPRPGPRPSARPSALGPRPLAVACLPAPTSSAHVSWARPLLHEQFQTARGLSGLSLPKGPTRCICSTRKTGQPEASPLRPAGGWVVVAAWFSRS